MEYGVFSSLALFFIGIALGLPLCWVFLGSKDRSILAKEVEATLVSDQGQEKIPLVTYFNRK